MGRDRKTSDLISLRNGEAKGAEVSRDDAIKAGANGTVYGIDADGWRQRAETFQAEANRYQQELDEHRRR